MKPNGGGFGALYRAGDYLELSFYKTFNSNEGKYFNCEKQN